MTSTKAPFFILVSLPMAGIDDDPQHLFNTLALRPCPSAEVVRVNNIDEANHLAFQRYGINFYGHFVDGNARPLSLPVHGKFLVIPRPNETQEPQVPTLLSKSMIAQVNDFGGTWGITAVNGFGAGFNLSEMVSVLMHEPLVYPTARWFSNPHLAMEWSRYDYVRRFYSRFLGTSFAPRVPMPSEIYAKRMFIDSDYESRDESRQENELQGKFLSYGLIG